MQASSSSHAPTSGSSPVAELRAAFRDVHGPRLQGFALLITLGDQPRAARLARAALDAGGARAVELSHPERAAAWLRRRVLDAATHGRSRRADEPGRRAALQSIGVDRVAFAGLAVLDLRERAALVAASIERLDARDVATIVGTDGSRLERLLHRARSRAVAAGAVSFEDDPPREGPIARQIRAVAAQVMG